MVRDLHHYHTCRKNGGARIRRHDTITAWVRRMVTLAGGDVFVEYHMRGKYDEHREKSKNARPDALVILGGEVFLVDVAVTHPAAPSFVHRARQSGLRAMEGRKRRKYEQYARQVDGAVAPFVLESYGTVGDSAKSFVQKLAAHAADHTGVSLKAFRAQALGELSVALQRGNAAVALVGQNVSRSGVFGGR